MKTTATILLLIISKIVLGTNPYLRIITSNEDISYPPNTKFELYDSSNTIIASDKTLKGKFEITGNCKLVIYPYWKDSQDIYYLNSGTIRMETSDQYMQAFNKPTYSNPVYFTKTIRKSAKSNAYNLTLKGSNGLEFKYVDGIGIATYREKELKISGKYVIDCQEGTLKVSFNPQTKETWWVFQNTEK